MSKFFYVRYIFDSSNKESDAFVCAKCCDHLVKSLNDPSNHIAEDITGQVPKHIAECENCFAPATEQEEINRAEMANERFYSDFHGGSESITSNERHMQAYEQKRNLK